jgi:hypothetical protein
MNAITTRQTVSKSASILPTVIILSILFIQPFAFAEYDFNAFLIPQGQWVQYQASNENAAEKYNTELSRSGDTSDPIDTSLSDENTFKAKVLQLSYRIWAGHQSHFIVNAFDSSSLYHRDVLNLCLYHLNEAKAFIIFRNISEKSMPISVSFPTCVGLGVSWHF